MYNDIENQSQMNKHNKNYSVNLQELSSAAKEIRDMLKAAADRGEAYKPGLENLVALQVNVKNALLTFFDMYDDAKKEKDETSAVIADRYGLGSKAYNDASDDARIKFVNTAEQARSDAHDYVEQLCNAEIERLQAAIIAPISEDGVNTLSVIKIMGPDALSEGEKGALLTKFKSEYLTYKALNQLFYKRSPHATPQSAPFVGADSQAEAVETLRASALAMISGYVGIRQYTARRLEADGVVDESFERFLHVNGANMEPEKEVETDGGQES